MRILRASLAARIQEARAARCGEDTAAIAEAVGVPEATWRNYESGVSIPGEYLLRFIVTAGVRPSWLLTGDGPIFQTEVHLTSAN
jgi:hypothetical protein